MRKRRGDFKIVSRYSSILLNSDETFFTCDFPTGIPLSLYLTEIGQNVRVFQKNLKTAGETLLIQTAFLNYVFKVTNFALHLNRW